MLTHWLRAGSISAFGLALLLAGCSGGSSALPSSASSQNHAISHKKAFQSGGVSLTLTPNYSANFGPVPAYYPKSKLSPPAPGPAASLDGGDIDFGTVSPGLEYYYQYGMQVAISDTSAYTVLAAISGDFGPGLPASSLTWLPSNPTKYGQGEAEYNNLPFGSEANPLPIYNGTTSTTLSYDYILNVPVGAQSGSASAQIEYSVIP